MLYSSGWDGAVRRWDIESRQQLPLPQGVRGSGVVAAAPDGDAAAGEHDCARLDRSALAQLGALAPDASEDVLGRFASMYRDAAVTLLDQLRDAHVEASNELASLRAELETMSVAVNQLAELRAQVDALLALRVAKGGK